MTDNLDAGAVAMARLGDLGDHMKVLIAVKGTEHTSFFESIMALGCLAAAHEIVLVHVVDVEPRSGIEGGRERFMVHRSLSSTRTGQIESAELEAANRALQSVHGVLISGGIPDGRIHRSVLRGRPNEVVRHLAEEEAIDLIVVGGRPGKPGPHSLGKTARFLIDHAPHAALLVKSQ